MEQICSNMNDIYSGLWTVNHHHKVFASFHECQHTIKSRHSLKKLPGEKDMYTYKNHHILGAKFSPSNSCQMYNLTAAVNSLQSLVHGRKSNNSEPAEFINIHFVGDSLMFQNW
jgi:hypothetical protein